MYYALNCNLESSTNIFDTIHIIASCNAWVGWVLVNALLHSSWVSVLTACQMYQVVCLGMTTNERMNRGRYRHFQANGGKSPFTRGWIHNFFDFFEFNCFGTVQANRVDWMTYQEVKRNIEHEPLLLRGGQIDNLNSVNQFV